MPETVTVEERLAALETELADVRRAAVALARDYARQVYGHKGGLRWDGEQWCGARDGGGWDRAG
jgi:hypothetical protein